MLAWISPTMHSASRLRINPVVWQTLDSFPIPHWSGAFARRLSWLAGIRQFLPRRTRFRVAQSPCCIRHGRIESKGGFKPPQRSAQSHQHNYEHATKPNCFNNWRLLKLEHPLRRCEVWVGAQTSRVTRCFVWVGVPMCVD